MSTLYLESVGLASDVRTLLSPIARRDQELARRLRRACDEVPEHIAEGMCLTGRPRRAEYEAARVSAREALQCLRAAAGIGSIGEKDDAIYARIEGLVRRISTTLDN